MWKPRSRGWSDYFGSACLLVLGGPESSPFTAHSPFSVHTAPGNRWPAGRSRSLIKRWRQTAQRLSSTPPLSRTPFWERPGSRMKKEKEGVHSWPGWKCRSLLTLYFALQRVVLSGDECQSHEIKWRKREMKGSHFRVAGCFQKEVHKINNLYSRVVASCWVYFQTFRLFCFLKMD